MPVPRIASTTYPHSSHTDLITTRCPSATRTSSSVSPLIAGIPQLLEPCATSAHHGPWLALTVATQVQPFSVPTIVTSALQSAITHVTLSPLLTGGVLAATSTRLFCQTSAPIVSGSATMSVGVMEAMSHATTVPDTSPIRQRRISGAG